ncbi:MAG: hydroxyisourate hydrolase [Gemmatimonadales bacterium]
MVNTNRPGISTHVLDTARGEPAAGVPVALFRRNGDRLVPQGSAETNSDGRVPSLTDGALASGAYQIVFDVAAYFRKRGDRTPVFTRVVLDFEVTDVSRGYHIPLLVSPYSCTSYRGS